MNQFKTEGPPMRSQKARGLEILAGLYSVNSLPMVGVNGQFLLKRSTKQQARLWADAQGLCDTTSLFVRPCPIRPRHGFVDSRVVNSMQSLLKVAKETVAADPAGELLLSASIEAVASSVCTPGAIVVGEGNDGATQGRNPLLTFQLLPGTTVVKVNHEKYGIAPGEVPYIESVYGKLSDYTGNRVYTTQVRSGPVVGNANLMITDYIPTQVTVTGVFLPTEDALEFERLAEQASRTPGMVLHHPNGCRASHFSAHCLSRQVPVLYGPTPPVLGDTLTPSEEPALRYDKGEFTRGVALAWCQQPAGTQITDYSDCTSAAILVIHHFHTLATPAGSFALGWAIGLFIRISFMLCLGELRHIRKRKSTRTTVYEKTFGRGMKPKQVSSMVAALYKFVEKNWPTNYGGLAWANCLAHSLVLYEQLVTGAKLSIVIQKAHLLVNAAHNGGWMFDKVASHSVFDAIAEVEPASTHIAALKLAGFLKAGRELPLTINDPDRSLYAKRWTPLSVRVGKRANIVCPTIVRTYRLIGCLRPTGTNHLHIQWGMIGEYVSSTFYVTPEDRMAIQAAAPTSSLSGSGTPYVDLSGVTLSKETTKQIDALKEQKLANEENSGLYLRYKTILPLLDKPSATEQEEVYG